MSDRSKVVVIGAGIAGVSATYNLAVRHGITDVVMIDPRPPLTLTSDKSTECYRNWWPNGSMVGLMNRSIDLLEDMAAASGNVFGLKRPGYLYVTADRSNLDEMVAQADAISDLGGGAVRRHPGPTPYGDAVDGVDVLGTEELRRHHGYITERAVGAVQVRRAGYFSAQQLGAWMLGQAKEAGARLVPAEVESITTSGDRVTGVVLEDGTGIDADHVVVAAGPMAKEVAAMAGVDLPLFSELHVKVAFRDHLRVIPRDAGMFIWSDPQRLDWSMEERHELEGMGRADVLGEMPIYCHGRPEGGPESPYFVALWEYHSKILDPTWPIPVDELYAEVVMKGLTTMVPGLAPYLDGLPEHAVDGGYYTKTEENRPLVGPAGPDGLSLICAFSGFGVMVAAGAGDLLARHVAGAVLPDYSEDFLLSRYDRPEYQEMIAGLGSGQL
jgi:glycine/D-amino acid oxidase-like deaminating enzyme